MQVITNNFGASRYDAYVDGAVAASLHYQVQDGEMWLLWTTVSDNCEVKGLAERLIRDALNDAHKRRLAVRPFCHEVRKIISAHPVYLKLVPANEVRRLHLTAVPAPKKTKQLATAAA
jgi:predicted GNAT family acetyltransferase